MMSEDTEFVGEKAKTLGPRLRAYTCVIQLRKSKSKPKSTEISTKKRHLLEDIPSGEIKMDDFPGMVVSVTSDDPNLQIKGATQFMKLLSLGSDPPIDEVIEADVLPRFVEFLSSDDNPKLQVAALSVLTNIASGTRENTKQIINEDAVPVFVQLLTSPDDDVVEQAAWALANVAGDNFQTRDIVIHHAMPSLLSLLGQTSNISVIRRATWTLLNLCRSRVAIHFASVTPALPTLKNLILMTDEEVLVSACWAIAYLSDRSELVKIQAIVDAGVVPRLVGLLMHSSPSVQIPALRSICNFVFYGFAIELVISNGGLPSLLSLLDGNHDTSIEIEACRIISNIAAGNRMQIQALCDTGLMVKFINLLQSGEHDVKTEAAWVIGNATLKASSSQIEYMVNQGALEPLCDLLDKTSSVIYVCLAGIKNILKAGGYQNVEGGNYYAQLIIDCGGKRKLHDLLKRGTPSDIKESAEQLIERYFWCY